MESATAALEGILLAEQHKWKRALQAPNTRIGYAYDWAMFSAWCTKMGRVELPATTETVSLYLADLLTQGKKVSTATRRTSAITDMHRQNNLDTPVTDTVRCLLKGAQRLRGEQPRQMRPLSVVDLRAISGKLTSGGRPLEIRNRAILVVGLASALRRDSLVNLDLADVEFTEQGVALHVRREKQDQEGRGRHIGLPKGRHSCTCPVRCLRAWLKIRGNDAGPLFTRVPFSKERLCGATIWKMVKATVKLIGLEGDFGPHSLRSGFITEAGERNIGTLAIANHTGHSTLSTLKRYFRPCRLFAPGNVAGMIGL